LSGFLDEPCGVVVNEQAGELELSDALRDAADIPGVTR
jgi:hypothetical protein